MKIIDLTQVLDDKMEVYPGDPEVSIKQVHFLDKEGWNLRYLCFSSHIGTHVNAPIHMVDRGKTLDDLTLDLFYGEATKDIITTGNGVIYTKQNIDLKTAEKLVKAKVKFVGLSAQFEFDISVEKYLLSNGIISFENLINTEDLPPKFIFCGFPLKIKNGDGSPVRAVAVIN